MMPEYVDHHLQIVVYQCIIEPPGSDQGWTGRPRVSFQQAIWQGHVNPNVVGAGLSRYLALISQVADC